MRFYKHIFALPALLSLLIFGSCEDRFNWESQGIGEGESTVEVTMEFNQTSANLGGSRSAGNSIQSINSVTVAIFNNDGSVYDLLTNVPFTPEQPTTDVPSDYPKDQAGNPLSSDVATAKVSFGLTLPYGRYRMYAICNYTGSDLTLEKLKAADDPIKYLKGIKCEWNPTDITKNAQMFGYFTNDITGQNTAYEGSAKPGQGNAYSTEEEKADPTVLVNQKNVSLYCWVKRLASKVTIAYDGSGLKNGVIVYVHNVSIRQIPLTCTLGDGNQPTSEAELTPANFNKSVTEAEQALYYNSSGQIVSRTPYDYSGRKWDSWMPVANGTGVMGATDHTNSDQALFFYENMQGIHPDKPKEQLKDKVGTNVGPEGNNIEGYTSEDYLDDVPYGTFIEVEAYYRCLEPVSYGPIRYRFMLGQNTSDNYDAIRNCHYKLTLGFRGYANEPDWHIEYTEEENEIYADQAYIPYTYNTSVEYPIRFTGDLISLKAQIVENNWGPYYDNVADGTEVPPAEIGTTSPTERTLQLQWNRQVYMNGLEPGVTITNDNAPFRVALSGTLTSSNNQTYNYLYGRRKELDISTPNSNSNFIFQLDEDGNEMADRPYAVTALWAGFLRLRVPERYQNGTAADIPAVLLYNSVGQNSSAHFSSDNVLTNFRNYFVGRALVGGDPEPSNTTNLGVHEFDVSGGVGTNEVRGVGLNSYTVQKVKNVQGHIETNVVMKLWTQPKSMCGNSAFSGNNPFEDFNRKAVVRFIATYNTPQGPKTVRKDVTMFQAKRLVNPKAVWRRHDNPQDFNVTLMERDISNINDLTKFRAVTSEGVWSARIKAGNEDGFISLKKHGQSREEGNNTISGATGSHIEFTIDFKGAIGYAESSCAIIEITYHNNKCVHNIFVRQGYHEPLQINKRGPYWSSYNMFSTPGGADGEQTANITGNLTDSPLGFGAFFKKGQYQRVISVSNFNKYGAFVAPNGGDFDFVTNPPAPASWNSITAQAGNTNWHWAPFRITNAVKTRTYRVPTVAEWSDLQNYADFGIGVMYGDGATEPALYTRDAYGFLDPDNMGYHPGDPKWEAYSTTENGKRLTMSDICKKGMRGFLCYDAKANQVFFPIGTTGVGRRTIQGVGAQGQRGILRYGSMADNSAMAGRTNCMRPLAYNIAYAPGAIYWVYQNATVAGDNTPIAGWDMNYFDLNFNGVSWEVVSINNGTTANTGPNGDALPLRVVTDQP